MISARRARAVAGLVVLAALIATLVSPVPAGAVPRVPPPGNPVAHVNYYRATAGLPPVSENPALSDGARKHSTYMVRNNVISHGEDPSKPGYTPEGAAAGAKSNVFLGTNASDNDAIDAWMTGPFHALGIIEPRLREVGFGSFREGGRMGATLEVGSGIGSMPAGVSYPVLWPGNGMVVPLAAFTFGEVPDPLTSCDFSTPAGLPITLQLGPGASVGTVTATLTADGAPVPFCQFDGTNYRNPNGSDQQLGRAILNGHGAVVLVPRSPLRPLTRYDIAITAGGSTHRWSFGTAAPWKGPRPPVTNGSVRSSPAAAAVRGGDRVDVFVRGSDDAIYVTTWGGSAWTGWTFLGAPPGGAVGDPAAVSWDSGRLDLFVRGRDDKLWQRFSDDGGLSWSSWLKPLGDDGVLASGPQASSRGPGRLDIFVRGTDGLVYQRFFDGGWNGTWLGQGAPPPGFDGEPASASGDGSRVDVFVRGRDATLWQRIWDGSRWSAWAQPAGTADVAIASSPEATSWGPNHLAVLARGTDGGLLEVQFDGTWALWAPVGRSTEPIQDGAGATSRGPGRVDAFVRGTDNLPYQFWL